MSPEFEFVTIIVKKGGDELRVLVKFLLALVVVLLLPLPLVTIARYAQVVDGSGAWLFQQAWFKTYGPSYLFWSGVVLAVGLGLFGIIALCWPRQRTLYLNQQASGQLRVTKKAIEQFVATAIQAEPYLQAPKVTAKLTRRQLKIQISGDLRTSEQVSQQVAALGQQLEQELRQFLGISAKKKIIVKLQHFSTKRQRQARVL